MKGNIRPKDKELFDKYPEIFPKEEIYSDPSKSCLAWGLECGDGWRPIIEQACKDLSLLSGVEVLQIKEKLGGMRFYISGPEQAYCIADYTEKAADKICENCGASKKPGPVKINGWLYALCDNCIKEL